MQKWEYKTALNDTCGLDTLGEQGWELVAVAAADTFGSRIYYFKRPKDDMLIETWYNEAKIDSTKGD